MASILVVEDKFADGRALMRLLGSVGHETKHVVSQGQAAEALSNGGFDYVFLDLTLPDGDGLEIVPEIRGKGAAVVLLLENTKDEMDADVVNRMDALGEIAMALKPLNEEDVAASIETADACRKSGATEQEQPVQEKVSEGEAEAPQESAPAPAPSSGPVEDAEAIAGGKGLPKRLPKLKAYRDHMEKRYLKRLLKDSGGNVKKALNIAGISRASYYNLLKKHGMNQKNTVYHQGRLLRFVPLASRMIRKLLLGLCLSCALLITLAALVLVLQDANEYKAEIETWLSTQVGSEVRIEGEVNLSVYPWIGLRVEKVRIASPQPYGDQPLVSAAGAVVRSRMWPLLTDRDIVLDRLVLDRPVITLRRYADGRANWYPLLRRFGVVVEKPPSSLVQGPARRTAPTGPPSGWTLKADRMHGMSIVGGRVQYITDATQDSLVVDQLFLDTGPGAEFDYTLRFRVDDSGSGIYGGVRLKGTCLLDPMKPSLSTRNAEFSFQGSGEYGGEILTGTVRGKFDLDTVEKHVALKKAVADLDFARVEFSVEAPLPLGAKPIAGDARLIVHKTDIFTKIWREVLEEGALHALDGLDLRTAYRVEDDRVLLENLHVSAASMDADGRGELLLGEAPQASILLDVESLNLQEQFSGGGGMPDWLTAIVDKGQRPDMGPLDSLRIGIDASTVGGYGLNMQDVSMDLDIGEAGVKLDLEAADAFSGPLNGTLSVRPGRAELECAAKNLNLTALADMLRANDVLDASAPFPRGTAVAKMYAQGPSLNRLFADGGVQLSGDIVHGSVASGDSLTMSWAHLDFSADRKAGGSGSMKPFVVEASASNAAGDYNPAAESADAISWKVPDLKLSLKGNVDNSGGALELVDATYELTAAGQKGAWSLPGTKRFRKGRGKLNLTSRGSFSLDASKKRILVQDMTTKGFGLDVSGQGSLDYGEAWGFRGSVSIPEFSPRLCLTHFGLDAPQNIEPGLLATCRAQADVEMRDGWVRFQNINLRLDESTGRGDFTLSTLEEEGPKWGISFDLYFDKLDADRYLFGHPHPQTASPATPQVVQSWNLDWLKNLRSRGRLRVGELELFDLHYYNADLTSEVRDSVFTLEPFTAGFYNGKLRMGIRGEVDNTLDMTVDLELEKFNLLSLLETLADWDRMGGETSMVMHFNSTGLSSAEHLRSLAGNGDVMVDNGFYAYTKETVKTEREKMLWREMYMEQRPDEEPKESVKEERVVIPVSTARGTIHVQNGVFSNNDFIARGDNMVAKGSGTMNIPKALLDYTIMVDAKVIPVFPIHIQGPLADPAVNEGGIGLVETLFTTFRNILTIPFTAIDALSKQARQLQEGMSSEQPDSESKPSSPQACHRFLSPTEKRPPGQAWRAFFMALGIKRLDCRRGFRFFVQLVHCAAAFCNGAQQGAANDNALEVSLVVHHRQGVGQVVENLDEILRREIRRHGLTVCAKDLAEVARAFFNKPGAFLGRNDALVLVLRSEHEQRGKPGLLHLAQCGAGAVLVEVHQIVDLFHNGLGVKHLGDVHLFHKARHVFCGGLGQDVLSCTHLHDGAVLHKDDTVADLEGFVQIVADEYNGLTHLLLQIDELILHVAANERVQRRKSLVHEQDVGIESQCAGQADALLHTTGQLAGQGVFPSGQSNLGKGGVGALVAFIQIHALDFQAICCVLPYGTVREESEVLEDHAQLLLAHKPQRFMIERGDILTVDVHLAGGRLYEAVDAADQGGLTTS
eukprot:TRINITY_DN18244_c0_g2_i1.p1 TRINITY_DN18244_c0_g2~~TRINITY_DN18244_c0_g2_i1.p1  ORF type:complete len:1728 (-),score=328.84 TRINITY_DN18244_c0_g2_i1:1112-6295(-)